MNDKEDKECNQAIEILKTQIACEEWKGEEPIALGESIAISLSRDTREVAIALEDARIGLADTLTVFTGKYEPGGWFVMTYDEIKEVYAHIAESVFAS